MALNFPATDGKSRAALTYCKQRRLPQLLFKIKSLDAAKF
jgi:hypothetical protein